MPRHTRADLLRLAVLAIVALGVLQACEPPVSAYRRSAFRPSLLGNTTAVPAQKDQLQVSGNVASVEVHTSTPELGDPALHVARTNLVGQLDVGLSDHLSVGGQVQGAHSRWSTPSADGTPPLAADDFALGVGLHGSVHTDRRGLYGSLSLGATVMQVPWATWQLEAGEAERCPPCEDGPPRYTQIDSGEQLVLLYNASATGGWFFTEHLGLYGGLSLQNSLTNIGFSDEPHDGSTLADAAHLVPFAGLSVTTDDGPYLQLQLYGPWDDSLHGLSPGLMATVGVEL